MTERKGDYERVLLPVGPIRTLLLAHRGEWRALARNTGLSDRTISRLAKEQKHVRLDVADRIAMALGEHLGLLYLDIEPDRRYKKAS